MLFTGALGKVNSKHYQKVNWVDGLQHAKNTAQPSGTPSNQGHTSLFVLKTLHMPRSPFMPPLPTSQREHCPAQAVTQDLSVTESQQPASTTSSVREDFGLLRKMLDKILRYFVAFNNLLQITHF